MFLGTDTCFLAFLMSHFIGLSHSMFSVHVGQLLPQLGVSIYELFLLFINLHLAGMIAQTTAGILIEFWRTWNG